jgi:hypothetical protein
MPKFDLDINGVGAGAAEGREAWKGEAPPTGTYEGILKILSVDVISDQSADWAGRPKLRVGVELRNTPGGKYDGYLAWGNLNLIDPSIPFVNQFLLALTDGSERQQKAIETAFYVTKPDLDNRKKHIVDIGRWHIGSPEGQLPIKVSISNKGFFNEKTKQTTQQVRIESYLLGGGAGPLGAGNGSVDEIPEEETAVELEPEDMYADESILDAP